MAAASSSSSRSPSTGRRRCTASTPAAGDRATDGSRGRSDARLDAPRRDPPRPRQDAVRAGGCRRRSRSRGSRRSRSSSSSRSPSRFFGYKVVVEQHVIVFDALDRLVAGAHGLAQRPAEAGRDRLHPAADRHARRWSRSPRSRDLVDVRARAAAVLGDLRRRRRSRSSTGCSPRREMGFLRFGWSSCWSRSTRCSPSTRSTGCPRPFYFLLVGFALFCFVAWARTLSVALSDRHRAGARGRRRSSATSSSPGRSCSAFVFAAVLAPRDREGDEVAGIGRRLPGADLLLRRAVDLLQPDRPRRARSSGSTSTRTEPIFATGPRPRLQLRRRPRQRARDRADLPAHPGRDPVPPVQRVPRGRSGVGRLRAPDPDQHRLVDRERARSPARSTRSSSRTRCPACSRRSPGSPGSTTCSRALRTIIAIRTIVGAAIALAVRLGPDEGLPAPEPRAGVHARCAIERGPGGHVLARRLHRRHRRRSATSPTSSRTSTAARDDILTDNSRTFGVIVLTGEPELFLDRVDKGDDDWRRSSRTRTARSTTSSIERSDLISDEYPGIEDGEVEGFEVLTQNDRYTVIGVAEEDPTPRRHAAQRRRRKAASTTADEAARPRPAGAAARHRGDEPRTRRRVAVPGAARPRPASRRRRSAPRSPPRSTAGRLAAAALAGSSRLSAGWRTVRG